MATGHSPYARSPRTCLWPAAPARVCAVPGGVAARPARPVYAPPDCTYDPGASSYRHPAVSIES